MSRRGHYNDAARYWPAAAILNRYPVRIQGGQVEVRITSIHSAG
jgi:hypothetical protein